MSNHLPPTPAGWYPDQNGSQRYWDGQRWLDIPAPPSMSQSATAVRRPWHRRIWPWMVIGLAGVVVIAAAVTGVTVAVQGQERDAEAAAALAELEAEETARVEAEERAVEEAAAQERTQETQDRSERARRAEVIPQVESAVSEMAVEHITDGIIEGAVIEVHCTPVDGYSIDDLSQPSAVLECFVATEDNGDGTYSGFPYNATVNWTTGQYSYGFGAP